MPRTPAEKELALTLLTERLERGRALRQILARGVENPASVYQGVVPHVIEWAHETLAIVKQHALAYADDFWSNDDEGFKPHGQDDNPWHTVRPHFELLMGRLGDIIERIAQEHPAA